MPADDDVGRPPVLRPPEATPKALESVEFSRGMFGYDPAQVNEVLARVQTTYEQALDAQNMLEREARDLRAEVARIQEDRNAISAVLVDARRRADELEASAQTDGQRRIAEAQAEAERLLGEARAQAEAILQGARTAAEQMATLQREMRAGYRGFLLAALELLEPRSPHAGEISATHDAQTVEEPQPVAARVA